VKGLARLYGTGWKKQGIGNREQGLGSRPVSKAAGFPGLCFPTLSAEHHPRTEDLSVGAPRSAERMGHGAWSALLKAFPYSLFPIF